MELKKNTKSATKPRKSEVKEIAEANPLAKNLEEATKPRRSEAKKISDVKPLAKNLDGATKSKKRAAGKQVDKEAAKAAAKKSYEYNKLLNAYTLAEAKLKVANYGGNPEAASYEKYLKEHFRGKA